LRTNRGLDESDPVESFDLRGANTGTGSVRNPESDAGFVPDGGSGEPGEAAVGDGEPCEATVAVGGGGLPAPEAAHPAATRRVGRLHPIRG
jgi:hypothetical protein